VTQVDENGKLVAMVKKSNAMLDAYRRYKQTVENTYNDELAKFTDIEGKAKAIADKSEGAVEISAINSKIVEIRQNFKVAMLATIPEVNEATLPAD
jgi:predicted patatin/cPLA2 family phospholipase